VRAAIFIVLSGCATVFPPHQCLKVAFSGRVPSPHFTLANKPIEELDGMSLLRGNPASRRETQISDVEMSFGFLTGAGGIAGGLIGYLLLEGQLPSAGSAQTPLGAVLVGATLPLALGAAFLLADHLNHLSRAVDRYNGTLAPRCATSSSTESPLSRPASERAD
jgi:hypothetical protein